MQLFHVSLIHFSKIVFCVQTLFDLQSKVKNNMVLVLLYNYFDGFSVLFSTLSLKNRVFSKKGVQSLAR